MRILITGVTGQVGSALRQSLAAAGTVIAADRSVLDLSRPQELAPRLDALRPDLIVNSAAYTAVDRAERDRDAAFAVNGESPGRIARWAAEQNVPLIHFSTDYVFDGSGTQRWREDDRPNPLNVYGASKLAGEIAVREADGLHLIIRTSWVYAASGRNFFRTVAGLAREREELRVVADQIGAPTSAAWISETVSRIVAAGSPDLAAAFRQARHCLNVAAAGETSRHGFAVAIVDGLKRRGIPIRARSVVPIGREDVAAPARRPKNSRLDLSRLTATFRIEPAAWEVLLDRELEALVAEPRA